MILKSLTDNELENNTRILVQKERDINTKVLHHLREIEKRRLFAKRGYSSLFEYVVNKLGYSKGAAYRRIESMRLLKDLPEIEEKIKEGSVSLTTASTLQSFFKEEKRENRKSYSVEEKKVILKKIENKSKQQTEHMLASISPKSIRRDRERVVSETDIEIRFTASRNLMKKLQRIKDLKGQTKPNPTYEELLDYMAEVVLEKIDPEKRVQRKMKAQEKDESGSLENQNKQIKTITLKSKNPLSRYISQREKDEVVSESGWRCTHKDKITGKICGSTFALEFEHLEPYGLGGKSGVYNLVLRCRAHNQLSAIEQYGQKKMSKYNLNLN